MNEQNLLRLGIFGTVVAALCCAAPGFRDIRQSVGLELAERFIDGLRKAGLKE